MVRRPAPVARPKAATVIAGKIRPARQEIVRPTCAPNARRSRPVNGAEKIVRKGAAPKAPARIVIVDRKPAREIAGDPARRAIAPKDAVRMARTADHKPAVTNVEVPVLVRVNSAASIVARRVIVPKDAARMARTVDRKPAATNAVAPAPAKTVNSEAARLSRGETANLPAAPMIAAKGRRPGDRKTAAKEAAPISVPGAGATAPRATPSSIVFTTSTAS